MSVPRHDPIPHIRIRRPSSRCRHCGVDPTLIVPKHPWDTPGSSTWEELRRSYKATQPYLEWRRRQKARVKKQRANKRKKAKAKKRAERQEKRSRKRKEEEKKREARRKRHDEKRTKRQEWVRRRFGLYKGEGSGYVAASTSSISTCISPHLADPPSPPANAKAIYGPARTLDVLTYGSASTPLIGACIVEHAPNNSRSYIHCCSAKEETRLAAVEHLLVITEDILQRLLDTEGITSGGWLPATPQSQHASVFGSGSNLTSFAGSVTGPEKSCPSSVAGSVQGSRRTSAIGDPMAGAVVPAGSMSNLAKNYERSLLVPGEQSVAVPRPTRAERVKWMMGSEG